MLISLSVKSQENNLSKEIEFAKSEALALGFETIQEDTLLTEFNRHLVIGSDLLQKRNTYYWVLFIDNCLDCTVRLNYWNSNTSKYHPLEAIKNSSGSLHRLEYTFQKTNGIEIKLEAFVESNQGTLLYSILCKKKEQE
jgi:hypothetical protein